jgi:FkbM family methyltransferase
VGSTPTPGTKRVQPPAITGYLRNPRFGFRNVSYARIPVRVSAMNKQLIYDVGAHMGEDTDFYLQKGFKVVAIEANPELVGALKQRFQSNFSDGSLVLVDAAIAEKSGEVSFYQNAKAIFGTTRPDWARDNAALRGETRCISVKAVTFNEVLARYGTPYYLKVDIEGADILCLEGLMSTSDRPKFISIEGEKRSWKGLLQEFEMFKKLGYTRFKIVDQGHVAHQKPQNPPAEGLYVEHRFERGSSGLFGAELPGKWLSARQAIRRYRFIFLRYRLFGDFGIFRVFLKIRGLRRIVKAPLKVPQVRKALEPSWYDTHATV